MGDGSDPEAPGSYDAFYEGVDTVILGWNTYHQVVTELSPDAWVYAGKSSYVITHKQREDKEDIHFYDGDIIELLNRLKNQPGKEIWICGGANIVQQCIKADVIDRYHLSVIPVVLGKGIRLFPELPKELKLRLTETASYNGIVDLVYVRQS